jgi:FkbM family methyltransferase
VEPLQRKDYQSIFVQRAKRRGWLSGTEICLLDVGASGGIDTFWNQFRPCLRAVGFDPLVNEVKRLNAEEQDPKVTYEAAWIGDGVKHSFSDGSHSIFGLTSAHRTAEIKDFNYTEKYFNRDQGLLYSDRMLRLDDFAAGAGFDNVDVVKIDTDGFDYFVLEGARRLLTEGNVLLVECECQFHELIGSQWPVFADIDRFMREAGYRLVDLDPWRYTRAELPDRFKYDIAAQTETGQVNFCDALYMLDPSIDLLARERLQKNPAKLWKLAILLKAFGYADLAATTLLTIQKIGAQFAGLNIEEALDMMVPANPFGAATYQDYISVFERDPDRFYATRWQEAEVAASGGNKPHVEWLFDVWWKRLRAMPRLWPKLRP